MMHVPYIVHAVDGQKLHGSSLPIHVGCKNASAAAARVPAARPPTPAAAGAGEPHGAGCTRRQVEHAAADEGAAVVDGDNDAAAAMGDLEPGAERQRAVGAGHCVLVEARAGGGLAAGFVAVIGGHAG